MFLLYFYKAHTLFTGMKAKEEKLHQQRWEELKEGDRRDGEEDSLTPGGICPLDRESEAR